MSELILLNNNQEQQVIPARYFNTEELLQFARLRGYTPTLSLIHDWVARGLLDAPQQRGLGRARGSVSLWTPMQMGMFASMLDVRRRVRPAGALCNLPLSLWLTWGEFGGVSLNQIKKAMKTFVENKGAGRSYVHSRHEATKWVQREGYSGKSGHRRNVIEKIAEMFYRDDFSQDELYYLFGLLKEHSMKRNTQSGRMASIEAACEYVRTAKQLDEIPDLLWRWARYFHYFIVGRMWNQYFDDVRNHGRDRVWNPRENRYHACSCMIGCLGMGLELLKQRKVAEAWLPFELRPQSWLDGQVLESKVPKTSVLYCADGTHPLYFSLIRMGAAPYHQPLRFHLDQEDRSPSVSLNIWLVNMERKITHLRRTGEECDAITVEPT